MNNNLLNLFLDSLEFRYEMRKKWWREARRMGIRVAGKSEGMKEGKKEGRRRGIIKKLRKIRMHLEARTRPIERHSVILVSLESKQGPLPQLAHYLRRSHVLYGRVYIYATFSFGNHHIYDRGQRALTRRLEITIFYTISSIILFLLSKLISL